MTDADRFHIPPSAGCQYCGPNFLGKCPHIPSMGVKASDQPVASTFENVRSPLNQRCNQPGPQAFVNLEPLIRHFESELTRERNAAVEARYEVSRHRERIAELEAKLAEATKPRIELDYKAILADKRADWDEQVRRYVAQIKGLEKHAQQAENKLGKAHCERDEALERAHKAEDRWSECAERARVELTPGSIDAIKEAARLVTGDVPELVNAANEYNVGPWWGLSMGACKTEAENAARLALCKLLEELQPAATVKP